MKVARNKGAKKSAIAFLFERIGDTIITSIRLWRLFSSRRGRKRLLERFNRKKNRLWRFLDGINKFTRKVRARIIKRFRKFRSWLRVQRNRIADFHRRTPVKKLLKIYLIPLGALSLIVCAVSLFTGSRVQTSPDQFPEVSERLKLNKLLDETSQLIGSNQLKKAEKNIEELNRLSPDNPTVLTYSGAIYSLQRKFPEARKYYTRALKGDPDNYNIQFNLAELEFVSKNYSQAQKRFRDMLESRPDDEILKFRIFLCALLQNNQVEAEIFMNNLPQTGQTPARAYANAALYFHKKEKGQARQSVAQARAMYPGNTAFFDATFQELDWK